MGRKMRPLLFALLAALAGCGILEPEPELEISGVVRASTGEPVAGARVEAFFQSPWNGGVLLQESTTSTPDGTFDVRIGTPPGYAAPNCELLRIQALATGFWPSEPMGVGSGTCVFIEGVEIVLEPKEAQGP